MKLNKNYSIAILIKRLKENLILRTYFFSLFSILATLSFTAYNIYLGISFIASWNVSISIYYILLTLIRIYVILIAFKIKTATIPNNIKVKKSNKYYIIQSILLFFIDLSLAIPLSLMVLQQKSINYSQTVAIANAAYTTYKIIMAIKNKKSANKSKNLSIKMLRNLNLKDALVAILSLQYTLIITFDEGINSKMQILCAISTFTIWIALIFMSIVNLKNAIKIKNNKL